MQPKWQLNLEPRNVPSQGFDLASFQWVGWCSTHVATLSMAKVLHSNRYNFHLGFQLMDNLYLSKLCTSTDSHTGSSLLHSNLDPCLYRFGVSHIILTIHIMCWNAMGFNMFEHIHIVLHRLHQQLEWSCRKLFVKVQLGNPASLVCVSSCVLAPPLLRSPPLSDLRSQVMYNSHFLRV